MSKKTRRIVAMAMGLLALLLIDLGINKMNQRKTQQEEQEAQAEEESKITIASIATDDISSFSYAYNGETYSYTKKEDTWYCNQDETINLIQADIESMLSNVTKLKAERLIEETDENFADYGLDVPTQVIKITNTSDVSTVIQIGNINSTTGSYYLTVEGTKNVYTVDTMIATAFQKTLEELTQVEETTTEDATEMTTEETILEE